MRNELIVRSCWMHRLIILFGMVAGLHALGVQSETLRDPTQPLGYEVLEESADSALKLESVLISSERRLATINGQTLSVNESVSGAKVIKISAGRVTIIENGQRQQLYVSKPLNMMKKASEQ